MGFRDRRLFRPRKRFTNPIAIEDDMIGCHLRKPYTRGNVLALARGDDLLPIQHHNGISVSSFNGGYDTEQTDRDARRGRRVPVLWNASEQFQGGRNLPAWFCLGLYVGFRARRQPLPCPVPPH